MSRTLSLYLSTQDATTRPWGWRVGRAQQEAARLFGGRWVLEHMVDDWTRLHVGNSPDGGPAMYIASTATVEEDHA